MDDRLRVSRQVETRRNYLIPIALPHLSLLLSSDIISNLCTDKDTCNFYLESYLSLTSNIVNFIGIKKDIKYFSNSIESIFSTRIHLYVYTNNELRFLEWWQACLDVAWCVQSVESRNKVSLSAIGRDTVCY